MMLDMTLQDTECRLNRTSAVIRGGFTLSELKNGVQCGRTQLQRKENLFLPSLYQCFKNTVLLVILQNSPSPPTPTLPLLSLEESPRGRHKLFLPLKRFILMHMCLYGCAYECRSLWSPKEGVRYPGVEVRAGQMSQWLRALIALLGSLVQIPATTWCLTNICKEI